jgi:flagellar biosynthetic protein FlhB
MAEDLAGDRTEQATPKRRDEARERGQVPRSQEVNSTIVLLGGGLVTLACLGWMGQGFARLSRVCFGGLDGVRLESRGDGVTALRLLARESGVILWPVLLATLVFATGSAAAQVGWRFSTKALAFRTERLNPLEGLKRMVSRQVLFELAKNLAKTALLGWIAAATLQTSLPHVLDLTGMGEHDGWMEVAAMVRTLMLRTLLVLAVLATADLVWQRRRHEESLKMSKTELRQEAKDSEGDPQIKARLRALQLDAARRRMMADVKKADVVVVNPTHLAVALLYDRGEPAPQVVAKGRGLLAARIVSVAHEARVPVIQNIPLAQALFKACRIGDFVPVKLYQAVAEVLAAVYRASRKAGRPASPAAPRATGRPGRRAARQARGA